MSGHFAEGNFSVHICASRFGSIIVSKESGWMCGNSAKYYFFCTFFLSFVVIFFPFCFCPVLLVSVAVSKSIFGTSRSLYRRHLLVVLCVSVRSCLSQWLYWLLWGNCVKVQLGYWAGTLKKAVFWILASCLFLMPFPNFVGLLSFRRVYCCAVLFSLSQVSQKLLFPFLTVFLGPCVYVLKIN